MRARTTLTAIAVAILLVVISCASSQTREAKKFLISRYEQGTLICGDSHFRVRDSIHRVSEYKGVSLDVETIKLTDADRANGIEWKGFLVRKCDIWRTWTSNGAEEWFDCPESTVAVGEVHKRNGEWLRFRDSGPGHYLPLTPPRMPDFDCEDISPDAEFIPTLEVFRYAF